MHLNIAIARALVGKRDGKMKTQSLGHEIVYYMHPQHSIQQGLQKFGIKNCADACFAIYVDFPPQQLELVTNELKRFTHCQADDLNEHLAF